ncbi:MAG: polyketide cyclase / dehydrase and lipid transport [Actinobacteria bacterium]|jgi:hypothetical protein|nr:polyketide cyclase / dehydrase and lipid transport [Actinomycetota bacterium]
MSETKSTIIIDAPLSQVAEAIASVGTYPSWSSSMKAVKVLEGDAIKPTKVEMSLVSGALRDEATLTFDWSNFPASLTFTLESADLLTAMDGKQELKSIGDETEVSYSLTVALSMPVPDMMRQKAEKAVVDQTLKELKAQLEN